MEAFEIIQESIIKENSLIFSQGQYGISWRAEHPNYTTKYSKDCKFKLLFGDRTTLGDKINAHPNKDVIVLGVSASEQATCNAQSQ